MAKRIPFITLLLILFSFGEWLPAQEMHDYPVRPVPSTAVKLNDGFWRPRIETNRTITIPFIFAKCEETGRIDNFAIAGGLMEGEYSGERYNDTDVYKTIEGASYSLMAHPDPDLEAYLDEVITSIAAAQESDGYLFTPRTGSPGKSQPGTGGERWAELAVSHELYNAGHLIEAAVAHFQATGKRSLLQVAEKCADLLCTTFGQERRRGFPGHQGVELALVKLYRLTGREKYLALAKYFLDERGPNIALTQYPPGNRFAIYNIPDQIQAHKPVLEQEEAVGHAVRFTYMLAAMTDIAALYGDRNYFDAVLRLWENVVGKKMYLTGGIGARHDRERFGEDYELPRLSAYAETCASIGMAFWNHRLFLLTGEAKYLDILERVMYNGILSGVSLDGKLFFYPNPLESDGRFRFNKGRAERAPWFGVACCPGNISRFLPSVPGYVYATVEDSLYVNLFIEGEAEVRVAGRKVTVHQETRYPWEGEVKIRIAPEKAAEFGVLVRMPGWAWNRPVPTDLYGYPERGDAKIRIRINGETADMKTEKGFARLRRVWKEGDVIEVEFPMDVHRVEAHPSVSDVEGMMAVERGPLVYTVEWPDNGGRVFSILLPETGALAAEFDAGLLGGIAVIHGEAFVGDVPPPQKKTERTRSGESTLEEGRRSSSSVRRPYPAGRFERHVLAAIPYFAWAHRGPGEMSVWMHTKKGPE